MPQSFIVLRIFLILAVALLVLQSGVAFAADDSLKSTPTVADTSHTPPPRPDSTRPQLKPGPTLPDSLQKEGRKEEPPMPPAIRPGDSLALYFSRNRIEFNVNQHDLYPRNAAGFLVQDASYYTITYCETPLRTTVFPFGLPSERVSVQSGSNELRPYDRTIPADGALDFDDIATGDVVSAALIEGPLAALESPGGGLALLRLEPYPMLPDTAHSEVTVERGLYGYAYTRARIARLFSKRFGFSFSTDYRKGEDVLINTRENDDSYNIRSRFYRRLGRLTDVDISINAYRRIGYFPVMPELSGYTFHRTRRDNELIVHWTRRQWMGGQLDGRFEYQTSLSDYNSSTYYFYRTIEPKWYRGDLAYIIPGSDRLCQLSAHAERGQYKINAVQYNRTEGYAMLSGSANRLGGQVLFFGRYRGAQKEHAGLEGAIGLSRPVGGHIRIMSSVGLTRRWPDPLDRHTPKIDAPIGGTYLLSAFSESGTPGLKGEKRLSANVTAIYAAPRYCLSAACNGGVITDAIYYNWVYADDTALTVSPANDQITFIDLNAHCRLDSLGSFFAVGSVTARKLRSDRYGNRPPYSPRWQTYGQIGVRHFVEKYKVNLRLFGNISFAERPLSYRLEPLNNDPVLGVGVNASLKAFTFYFMFNDVADGLTFAPEGYGYIGRFYSWGFNWKFLN